MNEFFKIVAAFLSGAVAGLFFFGGLWWTVQRGVKRTNPAIFVISFIVRFAVVGTTIYAFRNDWATLLPLLAGFIAARVFVMRRVSALVRRV